MINQRESYKPSADLGVLARTILSEAVAQILDFFIVQKESD
jgi:hypothetical protein